MLKNLFFLAFGCSKPNTSKVFLGSGRSEDRKVMDMAALMPLFRGRLAVALGRWFGAAGWLPVW